MTYLPWLGAITLLAAIVTGALGYGFSSVTVPLALLRLSNRALNPALVLVEVGLNAYVVFGNRHAIRFVWPRVAPLLVGLIPGIALGSWLMAYADASWLRLLTFATLTPLALLQASGLRRPIRSERAVGPAAGIGVGTLYAVTTISGPPLAILLGNQGLEGAEFRAAIGAARLTESILTCAIYAAFGLIAADNASLLPSIVPSVAVGVPLGAALIRRVDPDTFRRASMTFDVWIVGFGLSSLLYAHGLTGRAASTGVMVVVLAIDGLFLRRFLEARRTSRQFVRFPARARE